MNNNLTHHWEGGYLIPDLIQPESPHIGIWGERRRRFLRTHQKLVYDAMLISGTLNSHLEEVDRNAEEMLNQLMFQMSEREGVTELLKAESQTEWVQRMNSIRLRAEEVIKHDLICA